MRTPFLENVPRPSAHHAQGTRERELSHRDRPWRDTKKLEHDAALQDPHGQAVPDDGTCPWCGRDSCEDDLATCCKTTIKDIFSDAHVVVG